MVGEDIKLIKTGSHIVDITGIEDHQVSNLSLGTAVCFTYSQHRNVIIIVHQATYYRKRKTILSAGQLEYFKN